jgi:hypothetical protein
MVIQDYLLGYIIGSGIGSIGSVSDLPIANSNSTKF